MLLIFLGIEFWELIMIRLKELRESYNKTQREVAEILNVQQNTYTQYETSQRQIPIDFLILLAEFYDVSVDYILGLTNIEMPFPKN